MGEAVERFGRIDTLINNAGIYIGKPFTDYTLADFNALVAVNLAGFFHITTRTIKHMLDQRHGHVVNVSTTLVEQADSGRPAALSVLTKGGLVAATKSLAIEYASRGLRVNAVSLGVIKTAIHDDSILRGDGRVAPRRSGGRDRGRGRWSPLSRVGAFRDRRGLAHRRRPKCRTLTVGLSSRSDTPSRSSEREIVTEAGGERAAATAQRARHRQEHAQARCGVHRVTMWPIRETEVSMSTIDDELVLAHFIVSDDVERSRRFYTEVLGGRVVFAGEPTYVALSNSWIIINVGGGPTDDKPAVTLETPREPDRVSSFLNIRVKDIEAVYAEWSARGAQFLTPPKQHQYEIRCYIRDPDGHLIEVGQTTDPEGDWTPPQWLSSTAGEEPE